MIRITFAAASLLAFSTVTGAAPAIGLTGDNTLIWFDTDKPAEAKTIEVTGVGKLLGIDLRPADKMVYGVAADGSFVTINLDTGEAKAVVKLSEALPDGVVASVDFNPAADKLRIIGSDGTNLRADPASGKVTKDGSLAFEPGDQSAQMKPNIIATAYLNSFGKPEKTAMYDIDADGLFIQQTKPNDGTLKTIGKLGIDLGDKVAFDIQTTQDGANTAWLATAGTLYTIDLTTGMATKATDGVAPDLRDIAILP